MNGTEEKTQNVHQDEIFIFQDSVENIGSALGKV